MRRKSNVNFRSPLQIFTISNCPSGAHTSECTGGGFRRHEKLSLEILTVERYDYMQEMDCHYFHSVVNTHMNRVDIIVSIGVSVKHCSFLIFATFAVSFQLVLSVEHELKIAERQPQQPLLRVIANQNVTLPWIKTVCASCIPTIVPLLWWSKFFTHCSFYWSIVKSFPSKCFLSVATTSFHHHYHHHHHHHHHQNKIGNIIFWLWFRARSLNNIIRCMLCYVPPKILVWNLQSTYILLHSPSSSGQLSGLPSYAAPNCLNSRLKTSALPKGSVWLVRPEAAQVWCVLWTAYSST